VAVRALLLVGLVAALAGCGGSSSPEGATSTAPETVQELTGVEQLASAFSRDEGVARLVLLLSPT
jgi:hypothetical protein